MKELWIWLSRCPGVNNREKKVLLSRFGSIEALYRSDEEFLFSMGLSPKGMAGLLNKNLAPAREILAKCARLGVGVFTYGDDNYPKNLRGLGDSPFVLYWLGNLPDWDSFVGVGVVGTRKASAHALETAKQIACDLCKGGAGVVSGMAAGIDTWATVGALEAGGTAIGVLGCGIDIEYPASNHNLYMRMRQKGCLISEYPPGMRAQQWTFPERNRIISALSEATLVVEAPERSGALITARDAKAQGKLLFAVPGPEGWLCCAGSNALLSQGAAKAEKAEDILGSLPGFPKKQVDKGAAISYSVADEAFPAENKALSPAPKGVSPEGQQILDSLNAGPMVIDELIVASALPSSRALMEITRLELQGLIYRPDANRIALK